MDWANQPNPFRRYDGAPLTPLPLLKPEEGPVSPSYGDLYTSKKVSPEQFTINSISRFFEYALSITAWKEYGGNRWALRSNPSSGNLHPTEGYLVLPEINDFPLKPGLYHYAPKEHGLEHRLACSGESLQTLFGDFPHQTFLVGLSSIHWREAWKYGERAFRYCQHDIGPRYWHSSDCRGHVRMVPILCSQGWMIQQLDRSLDSTACMNSTKLSQNSLNSLPQY